MKHISEQEWGRVGTQFPNISNHRVSNVNNSRSRLTDCSLPEQASEIAKSGADYHLSSVDLDAQRSCFQSKCFLLVIELVSSFFEVSVESLQGRTRGAAPICQARQICMYLLHTSLSISYPEIGELFSRDRTTISHACMVVEDLRDDCDIERNLTRLESILETIRSLHGGAGFEALGNIQ